jgi:PAS domain S-box-containing protein
MSGEHPSAGPAGAGGLSPGDDSFRLLVEAVRDYAIFLLDPTGHVVTWNAGAERLKGYTAAEILGQHFSRFYPPEDVAAGKPARQLEQAARDGRTEDEGWRVRKDGSRFWANVIMTALRDPAGRLTGFAKITRDLTERKQAEESLEQRVRERTAELTRLNEALRAEMAQRQQVEDSLRQSEARFRQVADNLPDGFIYQLVQAPDGRGRFSYVSGGVEALCGVTPAEATADAAALYGLIVKEDLPHVRAREEESLRERKPFDCSFRLRTRGGEIRWLHCRSAPRPLPDGGAVWDGIALDITHRKRVEQTQQFLVEMTAVLAASLDYATTLTNVARLCVPRLADWCAVDVLEPGRPLRRLAVAHVDPDKVRWAHEVQRRYPPDPQSAPGVFRVLRTGRAELYPDVPDELLVQSARDADHLRLLRELGVVSVMLVPLCARDRTLGVITLVSAESRRRFGPADLEFAEEIGRRAGTAADNARLYGEVVEAARRKDQFLAMLAHELRNPLAPVRNALHILRLRAGDPAVVEEMQQMMSRQLGHLGRLIDDLLDVTRINRGKVKLRRERLDLARLARQAADDRRRLLEEAGVTLRVEVPETPVWVTGDATRLAQVLDNLLSNAAKFTARGGEVAVALTAEAGRAVLRVRDTGVGIEPALLPHVFEVFTQAEQALDRSRGGLGLGLALVKGLVELHGGSVEADSAGLGQGTVFTVYLPAEAELPALLDRPVHPEPPAKRLRVLIVEDNRDAADSLRMLLTLFGYEVSVAYSGPEGVAAARRARPDVVVCDIGLPGMDGFSVASAIRRDPATADARLIAVTGYGQEEDRQRSREAGFDQHLVKPVDPTVLERLLAQVAGIG